MNRPEPLCDDARFRTIWFRKRAAPKTASISVLSQWPAVG